MIYAYGNVKNSRYPYRYNDTDIKLSNNMLDYWSNFVKTGNPNREGLTEWTEWNNTDNKVMEFGDNVGMIDDKYLKLYDIFDNFLKV
jgi:para-nitrobenzyl esterase